MHHAVLFFLDEMKEDEMRKMSSSVIKRGTEELSRPRGVRGGKKASSRRCENTRSTWRGRGGGGKFFLPWRLVGQRAASDQRPPSQSPEEKTDDVYVLSLGKS